MPRNCTVCEHESRESIDVDLAAREPLRVVSERYGVNSSALWRHSTNHLSQSTADHVLALKDDAQALLDSGLTKNHEVINSMLAQTVATAKSIQDRAILEGNDRTALAALKEVRSSLEVIHKFTVKQVGESADTEILEDLKSLTLALRRVLPDHRAAARDLVADLKMQGALHLASVLSNALLLTGEAE